MLRYLLHSTLILALFSCPLRCTVGLPAPVDNTMETASEINYPGCHSCCKTPASQESPSSEESHPDGGCFCLCAGAIIMANINLESQFSRQPLHPCVNVTAEPACLRITVPLVNLNNLATSSGRTMRIVLESFLC